MNCVEQRIHLYEYAHCLAYLDNKSLNKDINQAIMTTPTNNMKPLLLLISVKLNVSTNSLKQAMNGSQKPMEALYDASAAIGEGTKFVSFLSHMKLPRAPKKKRPRPTRVHRAKNILPQKRVVSGRKNLLTYIKALCFLQGLEFNRVAKVMGMTQKELLHAILFDKRDKAINELQELPFTIQITMPNIKLLMEQNGKPRKDLGLACYKRVIDRRTLMRYIEVMSILQDTSLKGLSKKYHHNIKFMLLHGSGEELTRLFNKISSDIKVSRHDLQLLLPKANVKSAYHAYAPRMYFRIDYRADPVGFREPADNYARDQHDLKERFRQLKALINRGDRRVGQNKAQISYNIWKILTCWSFVYNFNDRRFVSFNFKDFENDYHHTSIRQGDDFFTIKDPRDWLNIIHKLHDQLEVVNNAIDIKTVADSEYGRHTYLPPYGCLAYPKARNYRAGLAKLDGKHCLFTAQFYHTGIREEHNAMKRNKAFYKPMLALKNVKYNGHVVSRMVWLNYGKSFKKLGQLQEGDLIKFKATPKKYLRGAYSKNTLKYANYELSYPSSVFLLQRKHARAMQPVPKDDHAMLAYCIAHNPSASYDFTYGNYQYVRFCKMQYHKWLDRMRNKHARNA